MKNMREMIILMSEKIMGLENKLSEGINMPYSGYPVYPQPMPYAHNPNRNCEFHRVNQKVFKNKSSSQISTKMPG